MSWTTRTRKGAVCALILVAALAVVTPSAATAQTPGPDPIDRAYGYSTLNAPGSVSTVLLATANGFADSLASGTAQQTLGAQLLITGQNSLDPRVRAEINRLGATRVIILGGTAAISQAVEDDVRSFVPNVERVSGATRIDTARAVADRAAPGVQSIMVLRAIGTPSDPNGTAAFADSIGGGAYGYATGRPAVLVASRLDADTRAWLQARGVKDAIVVGGTAAVPAAVVSDLQAIGISVRRIGGVNRFDTAAMLVEDLPPQASGLLGYVDALSPDSWASGFAAARHAPAGILLGLDRDAAIFPETAAALLGSGNGVLCDGTLVGESCRQARLLALSGTDNVAEFHTLLRNQQTQQEAGRVRLFVVDDQICMVGLFSGATDSVNGANIGRVVGDIEVSFVIVGPYAASSFLAYGCTLDGTQAFVDEVQSNPGAFELFVSTEATDFEMQGFLESGDDPLVP